MYKDKIVIDLENKIILLNSEITKDYSWFYDFLKQVNIKNGIPKDKIDNLDDDDQNFIYNVVPTILEKAKQEWSPVRDVEDRGPDKDNWTNCSLCHRPNKIVCYIKNEINNNELNVGRDCVGKFGEKTTSKSINRLTKEAKETRRLTVINKKIPGIKATVYNWHKKLKRSPIIIPKKLSRNYKNIGIETQKLFKNYIKGKSKKDIFKEIKHLIEKGQKELNKIEQYVEENKNKKYIPTKEMERWLKQNGKTTTIKQLQQEGNIDSKTAFKIMKPNFMKTIANDLKDDLQNINIEIKDINAEKRGYKLELLNEAGITLFCKHTRLISYCSYLIFDPDIQNKRGLPNAQRIIQLSEVNDEKAIDIVLTKLQSLLNKSSLNIYGYNLKRSKIIFKENGTNKYIELNIEKHINTLKDIVFNINDLKDLINKIKNFDKKYSKSDIDYFNETDDLIKV